MNSTRVARAMRRTTNNGAMERIKGGTAEPMASCFTTRVAVGEAPLFRRFAVRRR